MYRRLLFCFAFTGILLCLEGASRAQLPPDLGANPPVFQNLGMLDTETHFLGEADCRECHDSGVPDRHHVLYGQTIPGITLVPYPGSATYTCLSCHGDTFNAEAARDCLACHSEGSPHHTTQDAFDRQCSECHGDFVADFDDGHYIPDYAASFVTPWTGLQGDGWNDDLHTDPHRLSDGSGTIADADVLLLDTGIAFNFGDTLTRTDPNELRFKPAGPDNDFMIDDPGRSGTYTYNVIFLQGGTLGAAWDAGTNTLTVTVAPSQTAAELIAAITAVVPASGSARVRATKLTTDGTGGLLADVEYAPLGGFPLNNRGFGAGSCSYCHDRDANLDANGDPAPILILDNYGTHHHIGLLNNVSDGAGGTWRKCNICHNYTGRGGSYHDQSGPAFDLHIRICEECHSVESLHNIQADSNGDGEVIVGGELAGYGHVGRDGGPDDSDCWGCHGFEFSAASAPFSGALIPTLYNADTAAVSGAEDALVFLNGAAFTNTANGTSYESEVVLTAADGTSVTLEPDLILDQGSLAVTIPAGTPAGNYKLQATKGDAMASNPAVISITPAVTINRAVSSRGLTIIYGSGFGGYAAGSGVTVTGTYKSVVGRRIRILSMEATITSWSDNRIVARFSEVPRTATVQSVFGSDTYVIVPE